MRIFLTVSLCLVTSATLFLGAEAVAAGVSVHGTVALGDRIGDALLSDGGSYAAPDVEAHITDSKMQDGFSISDSTNTTRFMLLNLPDAGIYNYTCRNFWLEILDSSFHDLPVGSGKPVDVEADFHCASDNRTKIPGSFAYRVAWPINGCVRVDRTAAKTWVFSASSSCWATISSGKRATALGAFSAPFLASFTED